MTFHKKPIAGTYICLIICAGWSLGRFARTSRRKFATRSRGRSARPSTTSSVSLCLTWFANRFRSNILSMLLMLSQVVCKQGQTQHIVNVAIVVKGANDRVHLGGSESLWRCVQVLARMMRIMRVIMMMCLWKCLQGSWKVGAFGCWWQIHGCLTKFDTSDWSQSLKYTHADYCTILN